MLSAVFRGITGGYVMMVSMHQLLGLTPHKSLSCCKLCNLGAGAYLGERALNAPFPPTPERQPIARSQQQQKPPPHKNTTNTAPARLGRTSSSAGALPDGSQRRQCSGAAGAKPSAVAEVEATHGKSCAHNPEQKMPHSHSYQELGSSSQQQHQQCRQQGSGSPSHSTGQLALVVHQDPCADWPPWAQKLAEGIDEGLAEYDTLVAENKVCTGLSGSNCNFEVLFFNIICVQALKMELSSAVQRSADLEDRLTVQERALQRVLPFQQRLDQLIGEVAAERDEKEQLKHELLRLQTRLDQIRAAAAV